MPGNDKPCVCQGSNENCRFCSGTGYVRPEHAFTTTGILPMHLRRRRRKGLTPKLALQPKARRGRAPLTRCPACGVLVENWQHHLERCPQKGKVEMPPKIERPKPERPAPGPITQAAVSITSRGISGAAPQIAALLTVGSGNPDESTPCPQCRTPIKRRKLAAHMRLRCPSLGIKRKRRKHGGKPYSSKPAVAGKRAAKDQATRSDVQQVDRMDRTKNIGFPVRETGKYGSHPGHDGMDDESGPD